MSKYLKPGTILRCVDVSIRKARPGAIISDLEKRTAGYIEVMEIVTVRKVGKHRPMGDAPAVWLQEIERGVEIIRRYRAKSVVDIDRPFFLDRFVVVRDDDDREPIEPAPKVGELA